MWTETIDLTEATAEAAAATATPPLTRLEEQFRETTKEDQGQALVTESLLAPLRQASADGPPYQVGNDVSVIDHPPLSRLEEKILSGGEPAPVPPIAFPFEDDDRLEEYGSDSFGLAGADDDPPSEADRLWHADRTRWVAVWGALMPLSAYPGPGRWSDDRPCPDGHWSWSGWQDQIRVAPAIEEAIDLAQFPTETTFVARIFEIANLLLDIRDPVCKFAAQQLAKVGYRAEFLQATTPAEYDAREAQQEAWVAEGGGR